MSIVIDASIALSWCFEDEASPQTDAIAERVTESGGVVPALFYMEIANVLVLAERRGRISTASLIQRLDLITQLPLETDTIVIARHIREIFTTGPRARANDLRRNLSGSRSQTWSAACHTRQGTAAGGKSDGYHRRIAAGTTADP